MDAPTRPDRATTDLTGRRIVYFGHDRTDSKVIQRIEGLTSLSLEVVGFTYRRAKYNRDHRPRWRNVDLGTTVDYGYLQRLGGLVIGALAVWRSRREVAAAEAMIARNLDTALLALFARRLAGTRPPLAYEVLDVHRLLVGDRLLNRVMRLIERWVLARCDLLVVSSPAYVSAYFTPVQRYQGPYSLLENKLPPGAPRRLPRPSARAARRSGDQRWTIGWCGTLRCVRSLDLLVDIARSNRDRVVVHIRGFPTETGLEAFLARIAGEPNIVYAGGYHSPDDLPEVYGPVDVSWGIDFYDAGKNSRWLIPNRVYEGGYLLVPTLALAGTETARKVEELGMGWSLEEPLAEAVGRWLRELTPAAHAAMVARLSALPAGAFSDDDDLATACRALLDAPRRRGHGRRVP